MTHGVEPRLSCSFHEHRDGCLKMFKIGSDPVAAARAVGTEPKGRHGSDRDGDAARTSGRFGGLEFRHFERRHVVRCSRRKRRTED